MTQTPQPNLAMPTKQKKGLAIWGLVLGILSILRTSTGSTFAGIGIFLAVTGIALSIIVLSRRTAGRGIAVAGLALCLCGLLLNWLVFYAPASAQREIGAAGGCVHRLGMIGKAIETYQSANDGQYPPNLDALLHGDAGLSPRTLQCPKGQWTEDDNYLYFYCAPRNTAADTIVVCEISPFHPDSDSFYLIRHLDIRRNYLRSDLTVQTCTESEFQQLLQEPQNRRFAEELTKGVTMTPRERVTYIAPRGE